ncbi:uncharacterized protein VTP21DRAFT_9771 [Calcarisporiella thermophila]|uniref:uncharacterized protein n=1 Tax=Calcarisporiella thermophila TaxID=911321 RepID=UPI0037420F58
MPAPPGPGRAPSPSSPHLPPPGMSLSPATSPRMPSQGMGPPPGAMNGRSPPPTPQPYSRPALSPTSLPYSAPAPGPPAPLKRQEPVLARQLERPPPTMVASPPPPPPSLKTNGGMGSQYSSAPVSNIKPQNISSSTTAGPTPPPPLQPQTQSRPPPPQPKQQQQPQPFLPSQAPKDRELPWTEPSKTVPQKSEVPPDTRPTPRRSSEKSPEKQARNSLRDEVKSPPSSIASPPEPQLSRQTKRRGSEDRKALERKPPSASAGTKPPASQAPKPSSSIREENKARSEKPSIPRTQRGGVKLDLRILSSPDFNPDEYLQSVLNIGDDIDARNLFSALTNAKQQIGRDLQRDVFDNYDEFVIISKEISSLESDILTLRGMLEELQGTTEALIEDSDTVSPMADMSALSTTILPGRKTKGTKDMRSVWKAQMAALWQGVEGSQKLLPYNPERHVIRESSAFLELHSNTFKVKQAVHLILLSDSLLVATRKRRYKSAKHKLVADQCWGLEDIALVDVKDSSEVVNAFRILVAGGRERGKVGEEWMYQATRPEEKAGLMVMIKRATEDLIKKNRKAQELVENEAYRKGSVGDIMLNGSRAAKSEETSYVPTADEIKRMVDKIDDMDVLVAHKEYVQAVELLVDAKKLLACSEKDDTRGPTGLQASIERQTSALSQAICHDLRNPRLITERMNQLIEYLIRLDLQEMACEIILATKSSLIHQRVTQLPFDGNITSYIHDLSLVVFTLVKSTCQKFVEYFEEEVANSVLIRWVKKEIETFAAIFKKQVFLGGAQKDVQLVRACVDHTEKYCAMLEDIGLDLNFLFIHLITDDLIHLVDLQRATALENLGKALAREDYAIISSQVFGNGLKMSGSAVKFYNIAIQFVKDICSLARPCIYEKAVSSAIKLVERYIEHLLRDKQEKNLREEQIFVLMNNIGFVLDNIVPRLSTEMGRHFERTVPELNDLRSRLKVSLADDIQVTLPSSRRELVAEA